MAEQPEEEDDYMADLSLFLPPEQLKKTTKIETLTHEQPPKKKFKTLNWQEQRKIDRERKQREEDEKTLVNMETSIPQSNIGFKMLKQMGYKPGSALGKDGSGREEPVGLGEIRRGRLGIGKEDPVKEKERKEMEIAERRRKEGEKLLVEFGSRKKSEWRVRRVYVNFHKAKGVLAVLENEEVVEVEKKGDESAEQEEEEEEEEEITEEDLRDVLMKLRNEHRYCFFCGCQYESIDTLLSNCPGVDEDDH
ncbi:hypothetical protein ACHQM5_018747 [Ranunculus cassubicifolius]